jgi:choline dehydrogenase
LAVSEVKTKRRIIDAWIDAAVNTGYKRNFDYNGVIQEGVGYFQQTAKSGLRNSTSYSFLNPIKSRKNLKILTNTLAKKINIKEFKAISVSVENHNQDEIIFAKKEIILSAGTTLNTEIRNIPKLIQMGFDFITKRRGPFTLAASMGVGFLRTSLNLERPDIQFHIQPFSMEKPSLSGLHKFDAFTTSVCQLRPESTGKIILKSSNIKDYPKIYSNYLSSSQDIEVLIKGVKIARRIASKAPLKNLIVEEFSPGAFVEKDDFFGILDWIKKTAVTIYHPVGTCKMGADKEGVVNQRLCVHGVSDLRVVDASIMPKITSGNTNAPTIMIAEKASDMILRDTVK